MNLKCRTFDMWRVIFMNNKTDIKKILAVATAGLMIFTAGCSNGEKPDIIGMVKDFVMGNSKEDDGSGYLFRCSIEGNPENLDPQLAQDKSSLTVIANMFSGLMRYNEQGQLEKACAKDYTISDDKLTYTFTLRDGCYWYLPDGTSEKVTADDFVFAFQRIFNPQTHSPYTDTFDCIKNARFITAGKADYTELGVHAEGDSKVVFELQQPCSVFLNLLTETSAVPCNKKFFESTKARYGLEEGTVISNGDFYIKQWFYDEYGKDNFIIMRRNPKNAETEKIYPSSINFFIEKPETSITEKFKDDGIDCFYANYAEKKELMKKECNVKEYEAETLGIIFNQQDEIFSNENIRKALALSVERSGYADELSEDLTVAYGIVPPYFRLGNDSYRNLVPETEISHCDKTQAQAYWNEGKEETGLISLENVRVLVSEEMMDTAYLAYVTQQWQETLNCYLGIETVSQDEYESRIKSGNYIIAVGTTEGTFNHPYSLLKELNSRNEDGYVREKLSGALSFSDNYSAAVYADIERRIVETGNFIPLFYRRKYMITNKNSSDIVLNPFTEQMIFRYAKYFD